MLINSLFFKLSDLVEHSPAKRDRFILASFSLALFLIICDSVAILINFLNVKDYIVLHYNIYFGISALGPWLMLLLFPLSGLIVSVINGLLVMILYLKEKLLSYFLAFSIIFYNLIVLLAIILIIYVNI